MASKETPNHKYTDEEITFIQENIDVLSYEQIAQKLSEMTGKPFKIGRIVSLCRHKGIKKTKRVYTSPPSGNRTGFITRHCYTDEEIAFLKNNINKISYTELAKRFSEMTGETFSKGRIIAACHARGIVKTVYAPRKYHSTDKKHVYSEKEDRWLRKHIHTCKSYYHLTELFNETFGTDIKRDAIRARCNYRLNLYRCKKKGA